MSVTDSPTERDEARAKVAAASDEQLRTDLEYWAIATADHWDGFIELTKQRQAKVDIHNDCQTWVSLIVAELQTRRAKAHDREAAG